MTENELLLAIYNDVQILKGDVQILKGDVQTLKEDVQSTKDELETVKRDVKHLKKEAIKMQAMDEAILDEIERVHSILDTHKDDKIVHTA